MSPDEAPQVAPPWFRHALASPFDERWVRVADCAIHYQYWSAEAPSLPGILLVHGNGAHAHWWDFIAPALIDRFNVAALDLSGNGDSGHRREYSLALYAEEVRAVAEDAGFGDRTILVGHSFGGTVCRMAASMKALGVLAMVLLDSAFTGGGSRRASGPRDATAPSVRRERPLRVYPSREEASRRFRLRPPQPCDNGYILRHLAYHSVREVEGGWGWKSDHQVFARMVNPKGLELPALPAMMQQCDFPVGVIFGEKSRFFPLAAVAELNRMLAPEQVICLKDAHHHLFLDRPQQFIDALRRLLSGWQLP